MHISLHSCIHAHIVTHRYMHTFICTFICTYIYNMCFKAIISQVMILVCETSAAKFTRQQYNIFRFREHLMDSFKMICIYHHKNTYHLCSFSFSLQGWWVKHSHVLVYITLSLSLLLSFSRSLTLYPVPSLSESS